MVIGVRMSNLGNSWKGKRVFALSILRLGLSFSVPLKKYYAEGFMLSIVNSFQTGRPYLMLQIHRALHLKKFDYTVFHCIKGTIICPYTKKIMFFIVTMFRVWTFHSRTMLFMIPSLREETS